MTTQWPPKTGTKDESKVADLFPGKTIKNYEVTQEKFSGIALIEHKSDKGETFHVWHKFNDEPVARVKAVVVDENGNVTTDYIIIVIKCSNGTTITIRIPRWR